MSNKALEKWEEKLLGEVSVIGAGNSAPQDKSLFEKGVYPFFRTADVGKIHFGKIYTSNDLLNENGIKSLKLFKKGTILIPKSGASTFLNHRVKMEVDGYVVSHLATVKGNHEIIDDDFLLYFLSTIKIQDIIQDQNYPSVNLPIISNIKIALPTIQEQQRIVKILDEAFENIKKSKQNALQNLNNTKELFESALNRTLKDIENKGEFKELSSITNVKDGTHDSPKYIKDGIPFITQKNIKENGFNFITDDTKYITIEDHNKFYQRSNVKKNDILISMIGANRGMACIVDIDEIFSIKNVGLIKDSTNIDKYYLLYYLKSNYAKQYIAEKSKGGAQEFVGLTALRAFPILYVDVNEQQKIVVQLDELQEQTKKLEQIYEQKIKDLDELKQSILQKAFNGEL